MTHSNRNARRDEDGEALNALAKYVEYGFCRRLKVAKPKRRLGAFKVFEATTISRSSVII